jgi:hypothetical protein
VSGARIDLDGDGPPAVRQSLALAGDGLIRFRWCERSLTYVAGAADRWQVGSSTDEDGVQ